MSRWDDLARKDQIELVDWVRGIAYLIARQRFHFTREEAEDVASTVVAKVPAVFDEKSAEMDLARPTESRLFGAYWRRAARNAAIDVCRAHKRKPTVSLDEILEGKHPGAVLLDQLNRDRRLLESVRGVRRTMSPLFQELLDAEDARALGASRDDVTDRRLRALKDHGMAVNENNARQLAHMARRAQEEALHRIGLVFAIVTCLLYLAGLLALDRSWSFSEVRLASQQSGQQPLPDELDERWASQQSARLEVELASALSEVEPPASQQS
jgi:hypothetical protein